MNIIKPTLVFVFGVLVQTLGGFDIFLKSLLLLMGLDYILGLTVSGVFKRSRKTLNGGLSSYIGWLGLFKKITILLLIIVAVEIDYMLAVSYVRETTIAFFVVNEIISIIESAGLIGVPIPSVITDAIDLLQKKSKGA